MFVVIDTKLFGKKMVLLRIEDNLTDRTILRSLKLLREIEDRKILSIRSNMNLEQITFPIRVQETTNRRHKRGGQRKHEKKWKLRRPLQKFNL